MRILSILLALGVQAGAAPAKSPLRVVLRVETTQPGLESTFTVALLAGDEESRLIQGDKKRFISSLAQVQ